jgi:arabinofuranan 3-O-arabinosyltransferase
VTDGRLALPAWKTSGLDIKVLSWTPATTIDAGATSELDPGVSELEVNSRPLVDGIVRLGCGRGPTVRLDGEPVQTAVTGHLSALLRGAPVPVQVCGDDLRHLRASGTRIRTRPSRLLRADTLGLTRPDTAVPEAQTLAVARDGRGSPRSVRVAAQPSTTVLSLPQNFNDAWTATLDGKRLTAQRVDGWQQGWIVPAGAGGTVRFEVAPQLTYRIGLVLGALGVLVVVAALAAPRRRDEWPPLATAPVGALDVVLAALAVGLLAGWIGALAVLAVAGVLSIRPELRESDGWGLLAAGAVLLAALPRVVADLGDRAGDAQWSAMVAVIGVAGSLLASGPRFFSRRTGDSRQR